MLTNAKEEKTMSNTVRINGELKDYGLDLVNKNYPKTE